MAENDNPERILYPIFLDSGEDLLIVVHVTTDPDDAERFQACLWIPDNDNLTDKPALRLMVEGLRNTADTLEAKITLDSELKDLLEENDDDK